MTRKPKLPTPIRPKRGQRHKPKPRNFKDAAKRAWIRTLPCAATFAQSYRAFYVHGDKAVLRWVARLASAMDGQPGPTECAHVGRRGLGQKSSDKETIPLSDVEHRIGPYSWHKLGPTKFQEHWNLDVNRLAAALHAAFEEQRGK